MRIRFKLRTAAYLGGTLLAIAAILWAESQIWYCVNYLRNRAETINFEGYHLSDHIEAKVRELNEHAFRFNLEPSEPLRALITAEHSALAGWLPEHRGSVRSAEQRDAYVRFESKFEVYGELLSPMIRLEKAPADPAFWRAQKDKLFEDMLKVLRDLSAAERAALSAYLAETRNSMNRLYRQLAVASIVLLAMGAALAALIYRGFIAPLRQRLRQTRAAMEQQEKLSSLGVLAAGVAHEIRNPLTSIKARLFTQKNLLPENSEAREDNLFITEEISRLERIVRDFLAFARPSDPELITMSAVLPFVELDGLVRPSLQKSNIALIHDFQTEAPVRADAQQLKQVLLNLVQNAAEAIGHDGRIILRTRTDTRRRGRESVRVALLEIEDNGNGIPTDIQERLFDPFFTTRAGGTGLGLSIAARILEKHLGSLEYQSEPGRRTIFRVVLPLFANHEPIKNPPG